MDDGTATIVIFSVIISFGFGHYLGYWAGWDAAEELHGLRCRACGRRSRDLVYGECVDCRH